LCLPPGLDQADLVTSRSCHEYTPHHKRTGRQRGYQERESELRVNVREAACCLSPAQHFLSVQLNCSTVQHSVQPAAACTDAARPFARRRGRRQLGVSGASDPPRAEGEHSDVRTCSSRMILGTVSERILSRPSRLPSQLSVRTSSSTSPTPGTPPTPPPPSGSAAAATPQPSTRSPVAGSLAST
jgi:hypothetical protein